MGAYVLEFRADEHWGEVGGCVGRDYVGQLPVFALGHPSVDERWDG